MQPLNLQNLWFYLGKTTISTKTRFSIKIVKNQFSHHFCLPNASETCSWSIFGALLASLGLPWVPFWLPEGALWASRGRPRPHLELQTLFSQSVVQTNYARMPPRVAPSHPRRRKIENSDAFCCTFPSFFAGSQKGFANSQLPGGGLGRQPNGFLKIINN